MKIFKNVFLVLLIGVLLVGCQGKKQTDNKAANEPDKKDVVALDELMGVSESSPIKTDKENKTVTIFATVNGKYFTESTRHFVVSNAGKMADMSMFSALTTPVDFYNALVEIGAKPGDNVTKDNAATTAVEGSKLNVKIYTADNKDGITLSDAVIDSNKNAIDFRFGGNVDASKGFNTGCIACLDSCFVGIVSNHTYTLGAVEDRHEVEFKLNKEVLPEDKTPVAITFELAE